MDSPFYAFTEIVQFAVTVETQTSAFFCLCSAGMSLNVVRSEKMFQILGTDRSPKNEKSKTSVLGSRQCLREDKRQQKRHLRRRLHKPGISCITTTEKVLELVVG